jgi:hypothetical protein
MTQSWIPCAPNWSPSGLVAFTIRLGREQHPFPAVVATVFASADADYDNGARLQGELGCCGRDRDTANRLGARLGQEAGPTGVGPTAFG